MGNLPLQRGHTVMSPSTATSLPSALSVLLAVITVPPCEVASPRRITPRPCASFIGYALEKVFSISTDGVRPSPDPDRTWFRFPLSASFRCLESRVDGASSRIVQGYCD